jgi:hypothetical protein
MLPPPRGRKLNTGRGRAIMAVKERRKASIDVERDVH